MRADDWKGVVSQLVDKTRSGRLEWERDGSDEVSRCTLDGRFDVYLRYEVQQVKDNVMPKPHTLKLTIETCGGEKLLALNEEEFAVMTGEGDAQGLRELFNVVVAEPRQRFLDDFQSVLKDL